jgi:CheY-like chemotaxis protein
MKGIRILAMSRALIIEDTNSDLRQSAALVKKLGFKDVDAVSDIARALIILQDAVDGKRPLPELVLLDLSFTHESGFEVLRYWKSNKDSMKDTRIVVWTVMGETEQQLCRYFGVEVVSKWAGPEELEKVLREHAPQQS